jgi:hypothetical protein
LVPKKEGGILTLRHVKNRAPQETILKAQIYDYEASNNSESDQCENSALWREYGVLSLGGMEELHRLVSRSQLNAIAEMCALFHFWKVKNLITYPRLIPNEGKVR